MNSTDTNTTSAQDGASPNPVESAAALLSVLVVASMLPGWDSESLALASLDRAGCLDVQVKREDIGEQLAHRLGLTRDRRVAHPLPAVCRQVGTSHQIYWKGLFQGRELQVVACWFTYPDAEDTDTTQAHRVAEAEGSQL